MKIPIYWYSTFTDNPFTGNLAAVCPLLEWLPDELMQQIALQNNLSETAFFVKKQNIAESIFEIRWFTPLAEVDLCGHATLATACVIKQFYDVNLVNLTFTSNSGLLKACFEDNLCFLDFPARLPTICQASKELLLGLNSLHAPRLVLKSRDYLIVYDSESQIRTLKPNFDVLKKLDAETLGIIVTAKSADSKFDFVSRFFAPKVGVNEDPVTGSAHCTLIPYWAEQLGKNELKAKQISAREGELTCKLVNESQQSSKPRVKIGGQAVCYLKGEIEI
jgi:PhzF family phenazine biosynthesis protein